MIKCCEIRFNREAAVKWTHGDFNNLNRNILRDTKTNIRVNTLKRIFGKLAVDENYIPPQATIEALQQYGGYVQKKENPKIIEAPLVKEEIIPVAGRNSRPYLITLMITLAVGWAAWICNK